MCEFNASAPKVIHLTDDEWRAVNKTAELRGRAAAFAEAIAEFQAAHDMGGPPWLSFSAEAVVCRLLAMAERALIEAIRDYWKKASESFEAVARPLHGVLDRIEARGATPAPTRGVAHRDLKPENVIQKARPERDRPPPAPQRVEGTAKDVRSGARHILSVAARHYPHVLSRHVLAARSGMAAAGGTYATYIGDLKRAGYLADNLAPTERGVAASGAKPRTPMTRAEIVAQWSKLRAGARKLLHIVLERGQVPRNRLAELAGMEASGGTFNTYLGDLRRPGLIVTERSVVAVGPALEDAR